MLAILVAVAAVIVILTTSALKTFDMDKKVKNIIATVVSLVAGSVTAYIEAGSIEELTAGGVLSTVLIVYAAGQLVYKFILPDSVDDLIVEKVGR